MSSNYRVDSGSDRFLTPSGQKCGQNVPMSYVVIFRSIRKLDDGQLYSEWSEKMENLIKTIDGYDHHFGFRDTTSRDGVTVSYFTTLDAISQWKNLDEHKVAQQLGRGSFYEEYSIQVCEVLRDYGFKA
jgi:heme-degrading monooxygenase HmoA